MPLDSKSIASYKQKSDNGQSGFGFASFFFNYYELLWAIKWKNQGHISDR